MIYAIKDLDLNNSRIVYGFIDNALDFKLENKGARKELSGYIPAGFNKKDIYIYEVKQVHGNNIAVLNKDFRIKDGDDYYGLNLAEADGAFTQKTGIMLCIRTADCVPVLFYDRIKKVIGAVHCGWKGTWEGIITNAGNILINYFQSNLDDVIIIIGPSICKNCYEVKEDFVNKFIAKNTLNQKFFKRNTDKNNLFFDLKGFLKNELNINGFNKKNIYDLNKCNFEDKKFYSYRRNKTDKRQVSFIIIN
ncbi:MAG: peptidoglycan editing factor PgeF [Deltaproteobacteria bacterium]|nr:peptidoglycan editing factor PgeF [Deltaproteobacteria bacterium]